AVPRVERRAAGSRRFRAVGAVLGGGAMKTALLEILRAPGTHGAIWLEQTGGSGEEIESGVLRAADSRTYQVREAIPRFTDMADAGQAQTRDAFGFKWARRDTYDPDASRQRGAEWCLECDGFPDLDAGATHVRVL